MTNSFGFDDVPLETLTHIIDLSVEDLVAFDEEKTRRRILLSLALVCKAFTVPSQKVLWRNMSFDDFWKVKGLLEDGFGKDKIVETFSLSECDDLDQDSDAVVFLQGVKEVHCLWISFNGDCEFQEGGAGDLSNISSLESLRELRFIDDSAVDVKFPSPLPNLQRLKFEEGEYYHTYASDSSLYFIMKLIDLNPQIKHLELSSIDRLPKEMPPSLTLLVKNLTSLSLEHCDRSVLMGLLPICTSLSSLYLVDENHKELQQHLSLLSPSSGLTKLSIQGVWSVVFPLWDTAFFHHPSIQQLQYLHIETGRKQHKDDTEETQFIEDCKKKGISILK